MEYSSSEMVCILKINTKCEGCKVKVMQILQNVHGVYCVTFDGEQDTLKVSGRVNPNSLLSVLDRYGKHAEIKYIKFNGEAMESGPNYYGEYGFGPYGMEPSSYPPLPYPQHQWYRPPSHDFYPHPLPPPPPIYAPPPAPPPYWAPPPPPRPYGPPPPRGEPARPKNVVKERNHCAMM